MRVIGVDPGTVTIDLCGLDGDRVFLDQSFPTADALSRGSVPAAIRRAHESAPVDLVVGPSGYGLPLQEAQKLTGADVRLAFLAVEGESGGIGGLTSLLRTLGELPMPVLVSPGVVHLPSVPAHRKVNRVDMGTADKVCAAVLGIHDYMQRHGCAAQETSFILLELGGAFTAALAVQNGRIVDGAGGTSGPLGLRAAGALDGEVAYLAGSISKNDLFRGGVGSILGADSSVARALGEPRTTRELLAFEAYVESAVKAAVALTVSLPNPPEVLLSGRAVEIARVRDQIEQRIATMIPSASVRDIGSIAIVAKAAAQGAALMADGLAGGPLAAVIKVLGIRTAQGSVLDNLYLTSPSAARKRLGIA